MNNNFLKITFLIFTFLILNSLFMMPIAFATAMSSENYSVGSNVIGPGIINIATSTNYTVEYSPGAQSTYDVSVSTPVPATPILSSGGGGSGTVIIRDGVVTHINAFNQPLNILPTQSGTLIMNLSNEKIVKLEVPKAITDDQIIFIIREEPVFDVRTPKLEFNAELISDNVFSVTAQDAQGNQITSFSKLIVIKLTIPELLKGRNDLGIYFFDRNAREWVLIPEAVFSDEDVSFSVSHLTVFGIWGTQNILQKIPVGAGSICDPVTDGVIDILDFNAMMIDWGIIPQGSGADCNSDGFVDILDFNSLMISWSL